MNQSTLLGITDFFAELINIIPKIVYFIFAALTSGIDAMQLLVRKLAGLDVYYTVDTKEAFSNVDPLSEFILGILGIGNSSITYQALNTVFWSLSIFALIVLFVSTMIAMIKSHYGEDAGATDPWKYIYTAIKAVLTYAIIPFVMIFGLRLSSFILVTLDNITTSTSSEEQIKDLYGPDATNIFESTQLVGSDDKSFIHYDCFGYGIATNNTPMGSLLFKAAAYNANRARANVDTTSIDLSGDGDAIVLDPEMVTYKAYQNIKLGSYTIFGDSSCQAFNSLTSEGQRALYVADQIDYAFCNNLQLKGNLNIDQLAETLDGHVTYNKNLDIFRIIPFSSSFSKYNVSLVWFFYNLWTFNYIVAFGGGISIFGILLSIIVGLMTRLIKGAALFLVYPPLLGISPMDNFKAFKSWVTNIMQQVLMAFGAILGMNIVMLLLPYLQNIAFFNIGLLDAIVSMVLLIAALLMVKDFIGIVSGFVGGADANNIGNGMKSDIAGAVKKGATMTGKFAGMPTRTLGKAGVALPKIAVRAGLGTGLAISHKVKAHRINQLRKGKINAPNYKWRGGESETINDAVSAANLDYKNGTTTATALNDKAKIAARKAMDKARADGITDENKINALGRIAARDSLKEQIRTDGKKGSLFDQLHEDEKDELWAQKVLNGRKGSKNYKKFIKAQKAEEQLATGKIELNKKADGTVNLGLLKGTGSALTAPFRGIGQAISKEFNVSNAGKNLANIFKKDINGVGKTMANSFVKSMGAFGETMGIDKVSKSLKDIFKDSLTFAGGGPQFKKKDLEGDKLQADIANRQADASKQQTDAIIKALKDLKQATETGNVLQNKIYTSIKSKSGSGSGGRGSGSGTPTP